MNLIGADEFRIVGYVEGLLRADPSRVGNVGKGVIDAEHRGIGSDLKGGGVDDVSSRGRNVKQRITVEPFNG